MSDLPARTLATVIPTMRYADAAAAVEWLCAAFGFEEKLVVAGEGGAIRHAQLVFGNGMVMVASAGDSPYDALIKPPRDVGPVGTQSPYLIVADADRHHARAVAAGAEVVIPLENAAHGGRIYSCRDPEGHLWNFGTYDPWAGWIPGAPDLAAALELLVLPAAEALARWPAAQGVAADFAAALSAAVVSPAVRLSADQLEALRRVDALLDEMRDPDRAELWTADAVRDHPAWEEVRRQARAARAALAL